MKIMRDYSISESEQKRRRSISASLRAFNQSPEGIAQRKRKSRSQSLKMKKLYNSRKEENNNEEK